MAISGKVSTATVAASTVAVVGGIVGPHIFPNGTPSDVKGLSLGVVTAAVTFVSGYLAKHGIDAKAVEADASALATDLGVPFSSIPEYVDPEPVALPVAAPVVAPVAAPVAVAPVQVVAPVAVSVPVV
jgi:uncharacterized membrane protein (UPF0136 family)